MIFGRVPLDEARGGILAHNSKTADRVLRKGALIDDAAYQLLAAAGYRELTIARLEPGDVPEGEAATRLATALLGPHLRRSADVHGRVNLFAEAAGMLRLDALKLDQLNSLDEAVTLATLADRAVVRAGDMVATLKIIPFAVPGPIMTLAEKLIINGPPALSLKPFAKLQVGLILSQLPQLKDAAIANTITATEARIIAHGGTVLPPIITMHETAAITAAIQKLRADHADLILISGASAVTDRQDIAPQAILAAGGEITHFGMPVDPGNLICFGEINGKHAIVLPGCARSPAQNGIDWVLDRIFAGEPVGRAEIAAMGAGGLLKEIETRPAPRTAPATGFGTAPRALPRIAAIILAAGRSTRMGLRNKLLAKLPGGETMIQRTAANVIASAASPVLVITGHQEKEIRAALAGQPLRFIHAPDYADGLAASLHTGIAALSTDIQAALICLGDMPLVPPATINRLLAAFDPAEGRDIIIPTYDGQRGNPVLWSRRFFPELLKLQGDAGARQILHLHMEHVVEIPVEDDTILRDFDTPETLEALNK